MENANTRFRERVYKSKSFSGVHVNRVLLISPNYSKFRKDTDYLFPNLGLCSLKTESKINDISILDAVIENLTIEDTIKRIKAIDPTITGFYTTYLNLPYALDIAHQLKLKNPEIINIVGGPGAKSLETLINNKNIDCVDYVISGDGEGVLEEIFSEGKIPETTKYLERKINLDGLSFPRRDNSHLEKSLLHNSINGIWNKRMTNFYTSKGCSWGNCIFCSVDKAIRKRPLNQIKKELEYLEYFKVEHLYIGDDNFLADIGHTMDFCNVIKKFNYSWHVQLGVLDLIKNKNKSLNLLRLMKDSGCNCVAIGFESGDSRILKILNKGFSIEESKKAIKLVSQVKIPLQVLLMYNNPTETESSLDSTYQFLNDVLKETEVKRVSIGEFANIPGTIAWFKNIERGNISNSTKKEFEEKIKELCSKHSVIPFFCRYEFNLNKILSHIH